MRALVRAILLGSIVAGLVPILFAQAGVSPEISAPAIVSPTVSSAQAHHSLTVTFTSGKLMIAADGCSLQEILNQVHQQTGAIIEGSTYDNAAVTIELGPGDPMKVLASLLYGSHFNYIIVAEPGSAVPQKIVLSARNTVPTIVPAAPILAQAAPVPVPQKTEEVPDAEKLVAEMTGKDDAKNDKDKAKKDEADKDKDKDKSASNKDAEAAEEILAEGSVKGEATAGGEPGMAERLANLPPGIDPAMAALYPNLFGGGSGSASQGSSGSNTTNASGGYDPTTGARTPTVPTPWNGSNLPTNSAGMPILPSNISQDMWNLYPKNVMDIIRNGGSNPSAVVIPTNQLAPTLPAGPIGLWDQSIKVPTGH